MEDENIKYEGAAARVEDLRKRADAIEDIFERVTGKMNNMTSDDTFQGVASNELSSEFAEFKSGFDDYVAKVRDFADKIELAANKLNEHEQQQKKAAADLANL